MIRNVTLDDAQRLAEIYNYYIESSVITFEEEQIAVSDMRERIQYYSTANLPWLVFESGENILGFAYASLWRSRSAYRHSVESTIYLDKDSLGQGVGSKLYAQLFETLSALEFHIVIGGIALPNEASVALHEKLGFEKVAHFKEVGFKHDRWIDVGYWQKSL